MNYFLIGTYVDFLFTVGNAKLQDNNRSVRAKVQKELTKRIGFLRWAPTYSKMYAVSDLIAGLTLGLTIVPQSIAYASLARLPSEVSNTFFFVFSLIAGLSPKRAKSKKKLSTHSLSSNDILYLVMLYQPNGIMFIVVLLSFYVQ